MATWQLRELLLTAIETGINVTKETLAARSGVDSRMVWRIFSDPNTVKKEIVQPVTSLSVADRLLTAISEEFHINMLAVVPMQTLQDAMRMAVYENLNDADELTADPEYIEARAEELMDLREMLLSDDVEERWCAVELLMCD